MSILTIIAIIAGILLVINLLWTPITNWLKSKTPDKVDDAIDDMSQLRENLNQWIRVRMLPGISDATIAILSKLKEELLKYDEKDK